MPAPFPNRAPPPTPHLAVGVWSYRATVVQDDESAAAESPALRVTVEDIKVVAARAAAAQAKAEAEAAAEQARQERADAERQVAAEVEAARKTASTRRAPQYGYQCMDGDEKLYEVCADHKAWIDGQLENDKCLKSGRTWDVANQKCGGLDPAKTG